MATAQRGILQALWLQLLLRACLAAKVGKLVADSDTFPQFHGISSGSWHKTKSKRGSSQQKKWLQEAEVVSGSIIPKHPDAKCDAEIGAGRLERYRKTGDEFCKSKRSSFKCVAQWKHKDSQRASASDYLCHGTNMRLTIQKGAPVRLQSHGDTCHWTLPKNGLQLDFFLFFDYKVPLELADASDASGQQDKCDDTVAGPLLLYSEHDWWNPYLNQAQAIMAYVSVKALDLDVSRTHVLFTEPPKMIANDGKRKNPMYDLVQSLFSQGGASFYPESSPRSICAKDIIVPTGGKASFIRKNADRDDPWARQCRHAPLLQGYAKFMLETFRIKPAERSTERVVLLVRKPSPVHPGPFKRSMNNAGELENSLRDSLIDLDHSTRKTSKNITASDTDLRAMQEVEEESTSLALDQNDLKQVAFERALSLALQSSASPHHREVVEASPEVLSIKEQAELFATADIIISAHSAALSWMLLAPKCAQILEFCAAGEFQFVNYAKLAGLEHHCIHGVSIAWGTDRFQAPVQSVVSQVNQASTRRKQCKKAE